MYRVSFDPLKDEPEWISIKATSISKLIKILKTEYIEKFRVHNNHHPNELILCISDSYNIVVSDLYAGFDIWCLNNNTLSDKELKERYLKNSRILDPNQLSLKEFKKYCELICTIPGEYGRIYLAIEIFNETDQKWVSAFYP